MQIEIELSSSCMVSCPLCPNEFIKRKNKNLSRQKLKILLAQLNELAGYYGKIKIYFCGNGEPLVNKTALFFALKYLMTQPNRAKIEIAVFTNNILISKAFLNNPALAGLDRIIINATGYTYRSYAKTYGCTWKKTLQNIQALHQKWPHLTINVSAVDYLEEKNLRRKNEIKEFCRKHNISYKMVKPYNIWSGLDKTSKQNRYIKECICQSSLFVSSDGLYVLCPNDLHQEIVHGSVKDTSIKNAWKKQSSFFPTKTLPSICKYCQLNKQADGKNKRKNFSIKLFKRK